MRYSCMNSVEYDLKLHHILLDKYTKEMQNLSEYAEFVLKPSTTRGQRRYYSAKKAGTSKSKYIGKEENEDIQHIREYAFFKKSVEVILANIEIMEDFLRIYKRTDAEHINELLGACYALPRDSNLLKADQEIESWLKEQEQKKSKYKIYDPASLKVTAFDGTLMRSRAEAIHHEAFFIYNVPDIFELPFEINGEVYRPDFTILDVFTMTAKIWEHLGNWFHPNDYKRQSYRADSIHRIDEYSTIGFFPEFNLLLSFGTSDNVFDIQALHRKVSMFAVPPPSSETIELLRKL